MALASVPAALPVAFYFVFADSGVSPPVAGIGAACIASAGVCLLMSFLRGVPAFVFAPIYALGCAGTAVIILGLMLAEMRVDRQFSLERQEQIRKWSENWADIASLGLLAGGL